MFKNEVFVDRWGHRKRTCGSGPKTTAIGEQRCWSWDSQLLPRLTKVGGAGFSSAPSP